MKKLTALLVSLAMVFTMLPMAAIAEGDENAAVPEDAEEISEGSFGFGGFEEPEMFDESVTNPGVEINGDEEQDETEDETTTETDEEAPSEAETEEPAEEPTEVDEPTDTTETDEDTSYENNGEENESGVTAEGLKQFVDSLRDKDLTKNNVAILFVVLGIIDPENPAMTYEEYFNVVVDADIDNMNDLVDLAIEWRIDELRASDPSWGVQSDPNGMEGPDYDGMPQQSEDDLLFELLALEAPVNIIISAQVSVTVSGNIEADEEGLTGDLIMGHWGNGDVTINVNADGYDMVSATCAGTTRYSSDKKSVTIPGRLLTSLTMNGGVAQINVETKKSARKRSGGVTVVEENKPKGINVTYSVNGHYHDADADTDTVWNNDGSDKDANSVNAASRSGRVDDDVTLTLGGDTYAVASVKVDSQDGSATGSNSFKLKEEAVTVTVTFKKGASIYIDEKNASGTPATYNVTGLRGGRATTSGTAAQVNAYFQNNDAFEGDTVTVTVTSTKNNLKSIGGDDITGSSGSTTKQLSEGQNTITVQYKESVKTLTVTASLQGDDTGLDYDDLVASHSVSGVYGSDITAYYVGDVVTIEVTPKDGYRLLSSTLGNVSGNTVHQVTLGSTEVTVALTFELDNAEPHLQIEGAISNSGGTITFRIIDYDRYKNDSKLGTTGSMSASGASTPGGHAVSSSDSVTVKGGDDDGTFGYTFTPKNGKQFNFSYKYTVTGSITYGNTSIVASKDFEF